MNPRLVDGTKLDRDVGRQIRDLRVSRGLSQDELGAEIGVNQKQMSKYERGAEPFPIGRVPPLCRTLSISPSSLFDNIAQSQGFDFEPGESSQPLATRTIRIAMQIDKIQPEGVRKQIVRLIGEMSRNISDE